MCGGCGDAFELSVRREYEYRKAGKAPRCATCRRPKNEKPPTPAVYAYWLERFTLEEIEELAAGMWPDGVTDASRTI